MHDTMPPTGRRRAFRVLLQGAGCVHPASVYDPVSARIARELGFECAILAGSTAALAVLGAPDNVTLTLSEFEALITRITRASPIPLLVDADHGYGNALSVMRTVVELERAGVAALTIEDTALPQPFGTTKPSLLSRAEGLGKIRAALAARSDAALVIVGRTSAAAIAGLDEAIARVTAYAEAGADAVFLTGIATEDEVRALHAAVTCPIILGGGGSLDADFLAAHGVRVSLKGHQPIHAGFQAVYDTMLALRDGTPLPKLADAALMARVTKAEEAAKASASFLA